MGRKVVIVGGVALGPKVGSRLKRIEPDAEITLLDKDKLISYGGCGIPYYIAGDIQEVSDLRTTMYHMLRNEEFFSNVKHFNVLTGKEVTSIDRKQQKVAFKDVDTDKQEELEYDKLVLATGSSPVHPPMPGHDLPGVYTVTDLHNAHTVKQSLTESNIESAVVVGGGAIGIEMAEALTDLWGIETTVVEMLDHVLPGALDPDLAKMFKNSLQENEVTVKTGTKLTQINGSKEQGVTSVQTSEGEIPCQLVIFSIGTRPNSGLAKEAGLSTGPNNAIQVDKRLKTSDPNIYAGGDCIELEHLMSGEYVNMPLGSLANRQGRIIANNISGKNEHFSGVVGNFCLKAFDMGIARAGLTVEQAREAGFNPESAMVTQSDRAHFYPTAKIMFIQLVADKDTRRVLGIQAMGENIDAVKARVDAVAALLPHNPNLEEISSLEVCYAPPFSSAMDIVNTAGNVLQNILDGIYVSVSPQEFLDDFFGQDCIVVDVRSPQRAKSGQKLYGEDRWINIPFSQLSEQYHQVPDNKKVFTYCNTGTTAFEAQLYLNLMGKRNVKTVQGCYGAISLLHPDFDPENP